MPILNFQISSSLEQVSILQGKIFISFSPCRHTLREYSSYEAQD